jgi:hypothetical protein
MIDAKPEIRRGLADDFIAPFSDAQATKRNSEFALQLDLPLTTASSKYIGNEHGTSCSASRLTMDLAYIHSSGLFHKECTAAYPNV